MSDSADIYHRLIDVSREAIANQQGLIAYHALSGALEDAARTKATDRLDEVEQLANRYLQWLLDCSEFEPSSGQIAELDLYNGLLRLIASYRRTLSNGPQKS